MVFGFRKKDRNISEECLIVGESDSFNESIANNFFSDFIINQSKILGNSPSIIDGISGKYETFKEICDKAKVLAASLQRLGVLPGETIAWSCENRLEYSTLLLACVFTGTVFSPINPTYSPDEIFHVLRISQPRIVFCSAFTFRNISLSVPRLKGVCHLVLLDDITSDLPISTLKFETLLQGSPIEELHQSKDEEIAAILISSGTTGMPKGVMLSYANTKYFCSYFTSKRFTNVKKSRIFLGLLPLYHGYGYGVLLASLLFGFQVVLLPKFEEKLFLSTIEKYKITNLFLVPPLMVFLSKHPLVAQYDLSSVEEIVCGAAPLSSEVTAQVQAKLPSADIRQGYGMTESSVVLTITPPHSDKPQSVGTLAPGLQAKVVDLESGRPVGRGESGEILVRGPCVMAGYCRDPEATRQTIDPNGWLHTGDVGYVDQQGYFYIVDRKKELIKYKGFQVAPAELESLLLGLPGVRDAAVVGKPDLAAGELPIAYVVLQPNSSLTDVDIMSSVNGKVSPHKKLRAVKFVESIPRNPSGKILRRILRDSMNSKL